MCDIYLILNCLPYTACQTYTFIQFFKQKGRFTTPKPKYIIELLNSNIKIETKFLSSKLRHWIKNDKGVSLDKEPVILCVIPTYEYVLKDSTYICSPPTQSVA